MEPELQHIQVEDGVIRVRLEDYLFVRFPELSRMYIRDVVRGEKCQVNGKVENKGKRVRTGDFIEIELDLDRATAMRPETIPLEVIFEDDDLIVVNKASGMLVHPTHHRRNGTLLNGLAEYLNRNNSRSVIRPGLVHRLDKETSGVIVVAKNERSHKLLARQFQNRKVKKIYTALVDGLVTEQSGTIDAAIGRYPDEKRWDLKPGAKPSTTLFQVLKRYESNTLMQLEPVTGRTNQLRIHCASIGHPILGDGARGGSKYERLCLHASSLTICHPTANTILKLAARLPDWAKN
jgi:23S rRNA pseudouridine1911/1915/1917 synthase